MFEHIQQEPNTTITVSVENQTITNNASGQSEFFDINAYKKECLLKGFDDIDYLLNKKDLIEAYETAN
jgi:3-isopropylmalate/(R)-2-methylmalate dehydratase small subunit